MNNQVKFFLAAMAVILLQSTVRAELNVLVKPYASHAGVNMGVNCATWCRDYPGGAPDFSTITYLTTLPGWCHGKTTASPYVVSGDMACDGAYDRSSGSSGYILDIYADAVPDSNAVVKFKSDFFLNWSGTGSNLSTGFTYYGGQNPSGGLSRNGNLSGPLSSSQEWASNVSWPSTSLMEGGTTFYKVGRIEIIGRTEIGAYNINTVYRGEISNIRAHYVGGFIRENGGDEQEALVTEFLLEPLSVRVSSIGVSGGAAVPVPGTTVTFAIVAPDNGAKFPNGQTSMAVVTDTSGVAGVPLALGTTTGTYKVKATCPPEVCTSGAREVSFTETAKGPEMRKISGDGAMPVGKDALNPLKVQVYNPITEAGVPGYTVYFSIDSVPLGGDTADISVFQAVTDGNGVAYANFTLGNAEGDYIISATCPECQENGSVSFTITGGQPIEDTHPSGGEDKTTYNPPETPDGIGVLQLKYQNEYLQQLAPQKYKKITQSNGRIGAFAGDTLTFVADITPKLSAPNYQWTGGGLAGDNESFTITVNGSTTVTLKVNDKATKSVVVTVVPKPTGPDLVGWLLSHPIIGRDVLSCAAIASGWAGTQAHIFSATAANDIWDAKRHVLWSACITYNQGPAVAESATNAHEVDAYKSEYPEYPQGTSRKLENFEHNASVMDFENNAIGRLVGESLPASVAILGPAAVINSATSRFDLRVLDDPVNSDRAGLLMPSR